MLTDKVILATDFSAASRSAVLVAAKVSLQFNASVLVVHVFQFESRHHMVPVGWMINLIRKDIREQMNRTLRRLRKLGVQAEGQLVEDGFPSNEIPAVVAKFDKPMLVMGTRSLDGIDRLVIGSTAEQILRKVDCPVITVGPGSRGATRKHLVFRGILFPTDFSKESLIAAGFIRELLKQTGASVWVLHVLARSSPAGQSKAKFSQIAEVLGAKDTKDFPIEYVEVQDESVSHAIAQQAAHYDVDLIVLGARQTSALASRLSPEVVAQVISIAGAPVLTVSSKGS